MSLIHLDHIWINPDTIAALTERETATEILLTSGKSVFVKLKISDILRRLDI